MEGSGLRNIELGMANLGQELKKVSVLFRPLFKQIA